jgi:hypothetical protein
MVDQKGERSELAGCVANMLFMLIFTATAGLVLMLGMGALHSGYPQIPAPNFLAAWGGVAAAWTLLRLIRVALGRK